VVSGVLLGVIVPFGRCILPLDYIIFQYLLPIYYLVGEAKSIQTLGDQPAEDKIYRHALTLEEIRF
jgi:hypothetical protein